MSELRRGVMRAGSCVEGAAQLFTEIDVNKGQPDQIAEAMRVCGDCRRLPVCEERLGQISMRLIERGVRDTVIAGTHIKSQLPEDISPARRRRRYDPNDPDALGYREFLPVPNWFLDEFAAAHEAGSGYMKAIHALVQQEPLTLRGTRLGARMEPIVSWLREQPFAASEGRQADTDAALSRIAAAFVRTRDSFRLLKYPGLPVEAEQAALSGLAQEYLGVVAAIKRLGFRNAERIALRYGAEYCEAVLERFSGHPDITPQLVRDAFETYSEPVAGLERFAAWLVTATQKHHSNPAFSGGVMRKLVFRAARSEGEARLDEFLDDYLVRYNRVQALCARMPFIRDHHVRSLALANSSPEQAVSALEASVAEFNRLAAQYGIPRNRMYMMAFVYRTDLERVAQRYHANMSELRRRFKGDPDVPVAVIEYFVSHAVHDPLDAVQKYLQRLAHLRTEFSAEPDIDDKALKEIARYHWKDPVAGAETYIASYQRLRQLYEFDDVVEDWMLRQVAAHRPKAQESSLNFLKYAVREGWVRISLDAPPSTGGGSPLGAIVVDTNISGHPEAVFMAGEELAQDRITIGESLLALSKAEREAVIHVFDLDWLFDETIADRPSLAKELGVTAGEIDDYVHTVIVPKLRRWMSS